MSTSAWARLRWLAFALALIALAVPAHAQFESGQISGFVRDSQGAAVPGATVTITDESTKRARTYTTDTSGYYTAPALPPGKYAVAVELTGFRKYVKTGVTLDAAAKVTADAVLNPGGLEETVTIVAEATPLQSSTGQVAKTIENKQIQDLMLNGRNPINLALLKPGVRGGAGGSLNSFQPDSLSNGGFNINGSRSDENLITIDGAIATRTRSAGAIIGTVNVDTVQEIQILTASYLPEYGRSSGGQIRFVTKGGGRNFHADLFEFFRDDKLDANSWTRNNSPLPELNSNPAPFNYNQYGYNIGGPLFLPGKFNTNRDKLFFFWAQEWIRYDREETNTRTVPSAAMRRGDFSELLSATNPFFGRTVVVNDPLTGQPFPGNIIPSSRLSPNGLALLNTYPLPTPGFQRGANNWIGTSPNPRRTRKDTLRMDFVPNAQNTISFRGSLFNWKAVDAFRGDFPLARTDWDRPNQSAALSWTSTLSPSTINEATVAWSRDQVFIEVFRGTDSFVRSKYGINYPYIFPGKEIEDKIPSVTVSGFNSIDGGPYPSSSVGPIWTFSDNITHIRGRHTWKAGVFVEYSGEDDFDQINVSILPGDTNNQNGRFEFNDGRTGGTGLAVANAALGLFTNYGEIGARSKTDWRALAVDAFLQDSWKVGSKLTVEGGLRYVYWPPWHAKLNNAAMFDPEFYDPARAVRIDRRTGAIVPGSGDPYNGVALPGEGFPSEAQGKVQAAGNPDLQRLFRGLPRGFSQTHETVFEPRLGVAYKLNEKTALRLGAGIFHTRLTLNDSTLLGGNPPIQFKVGVTNGVVDQPTGASRSDFPLVMTEQDPVFKHPTAYHWSLSLQRELPLHVVADVTYVGRMGVHLQRERNINQLQPGTVQANPGVNVNALRPYLGFATIRLSENAGRSIYHGLQLNLERRFSNGLGFGAAYTLSRLRDNGSDKRNLLFNAFDDSGYWDVSDNDRTHLFNVHYLYELPFGRKQDTLVKKILGGWQISGVTYFQSGAPLHVWRSDDVAGVGDTTAQPWDLVGDPKVSNPQFSNGRSVDQNFWFNPQAFAQPAPGTFGNAGRNPVSGPIFQSWDIALFKNVPLGGSRRVQLRLEAFNFINHPNLNNPNSDPRSADFGRVLAKSSERNIQLGVKFSF
ncbi:MAG TPA: carboxypeptidase regulatory-like domain-containing protein [Vicinamibacteria bacterium]|nr:carboxypeptidase regulatory-like domain-containing protein [Vicinamibacteria bacterium]